MGIVTGFAAAGGGGGAGGAGDVVDVATLLLRGGAVDGGAAYSGWRRGWKNERIEDCCVCDMLQDGWEGLLGMDINS
jgi:hypothetical protein